MPGVQRREIECRYGQHIKEGIEALIQKHKGSVQAIADELGVSNLTYWKWRQELGITIDHAALNPSVLTARQRFVLDKRFGLDGGPAHSMHDVALMLDSTVGAVGSVQRAALRNVVRNPSILTEEELTIMRSALGTPKARIPAARLP